MTNQMTNKLLPSRNENRDQLSTPAEDRIRHFMPFTTESLGALGLGHCDTDRVALQPLAELKIQNQNHPKPM